MKIIVVLSFLLSSGSPRSFDHLQGILGPSKSASCWDDNQANHQIKLFSPRKLGLAWENLVCPVSSTSFKNLLTPLLIPRVPGEDGNVKAREYMVAFLEDLGWNIELDEFTQDTVVGIKTFVNIIATYHPDSPRRLVVAAHYDSKLSPAGFIGATDSAVPCAMLLDLAAGITPLMQNLKETPELTLQLIFFDGEEAFVSWTATDSLYGSRHLAERWENEAYTVNRNTGFCQSKSRTELDRIDSFVLLDLIGAANPVFRDYEDYDSSLFEAMKMIENKLSMLNGCGMPRVMSDGQPNAAGNMVSDDQKPFVQRGINRILHLIATPFPSVWHTIEDNGDNLDYPSILYVQKLVKLFVLQYLNL